MIPVWLTVGVLIGATCTVVGVTWWANKIRWYESIWRLGQFTEEDRRAEQGVWMVTKMFALLGWWAVCAGMMSGVCWAFEQWVIARG